ncbi:hypothetical protein [Streptomyces rochei]|uniref:hypothetical protein n=1 Tax=Streptomyces rochei TaxID=1928 RepID=UPI0036C59C4F
MTVEHRVAIQIAVSGGDVSAPETAAVRLASLLHGHWSVELEECTASSAVLRLVTHEPAAVVGSAEAAVDAALAQPELKDWARVTG